MASDNTRAYTDIHSLPNDAFALWGEARTALRTRERGRPEVGRRVDVRLPESTIGILDRWAAREGIGRAEAARRLIYMGIVAAHRADGLTEDGWPAGVVSAEEFLRHAH